MMTDEEKEAAELGAIIEATKAKVAEFQEKHIDPKRAEVLRLKAECKELSAQRNALYPPGYVEMKKHYGKLMSTITSRKRLAETRAKMQEAQG